MKQLKILPLSGPVNAVVDVPGSKSYTNRALLIAALIPTAVKIINPLMSDDTRAMISCLRALGLKIVCRPNDIEVVDSIAVIKNDDYDLDANLSGTTIRFLLALCTIIPGRQTLRGQPGLQARPLGDMVEALQQLGAEIEYLDKPGFAPLRVTSSKLSAGPVSINGSQSSQYLSALLMIAPLVGDLEITVRGDLFSRSFVTMTMAVMNEFGVIVTNQNNDYQVAGGQSYNGSEYNVERDVSSAAYFAAIAALTKSTITLRNMNPHSVQADMEFLKILKKMGTAIAYRPEDIVITGHGVKPIDVDMRSCPDQAQTLAILAAFADGVTTISGIGSLRLKETERITALQQELQKMGINTSATPDSLTIHGGQLQPTSIATYGDHRMAMAFAVAGAHLAGLKIQDPAVVSKTFPDFWKQLAAIGVKSQLRQPNIVLIGMRGSGKTTVAAALAKKTGRQQLDIDSIMVKKIGINTPQIVEKHGWAYFRQQESEIAQELSELENTIISTGGGIILKPENITALRRNGLLIFLQASAEVLVDRLGDSYDRPPLTSQASLPAEVQQVLDQRRGMYQTVADITIDTNAASPEEVADQIIKRVKQSQKERL